MGRPKKSEVDQLVGVLIRTTASNREKWQSWCRRNGTTVTAEIERLMNQAIQGGVETGPGNPDFGVKQKAAQQAQNQKQQEEIVTAIMNAENHCWPIGWLRIPTEQEYMDGLYSRKIHYVDEFGFCYDDDLWCWEADGSYNASKNTGGGASAYSKTLIPALQAGWKPREPIHNITLKHVLYVLGKMKSNQYGGRWTRALAELQQQLQAESAARHQKRQEPQ